MSEDFISGLHDDLVEAIDRYERRSRRGRLAAGGSSQLLRPATLARVAGGAAIIVALVAAVLTVARESDVQQPAAPPVEKSVIDVRSGIKFSLDGRVLTVHLLQSASSHTIRRVSGARTSVTCGANGASPPSDVAPDDRRLAHSGATTVTQHWPAGQMSLSYRFRRDVSVWCRLEDPVGRSGAFVVFPGASRGGMEWGMESINYFANEWLRYPILGLDFDGGACPRGMNQGACAAIWRDAAVQEIAIKGDRATVRFSNGKTIELHREANGGLRINPPFAG
jgi:hypothetical protein